MESDSNCFEDDKLNEGLSYLTLSGSSSFSNNVNESNSTSFPNSNGLNDDLNSNLSAGNNATGVDNSTLVDALDDDVVYVGSSITVKTEKNGDDSHSALEKYDSVVNGSGECVNNLNIDSNAHNTNSESGWLISNFKKAPKAHYIGNANSIRRRNKCLSNHSDSGTLNKGSLELLDNIIDIKDLPKLSSQCSTVSNKTNLTYPSSYRYNCSDNKRNKRKRTLLREYVYPPPYNYGFHPFNDDIMYTSDNSRGLSKYLNPERINSWMRAIFNVTKTVILMYIVVSIFLIVKKDIETHIQRNVKNVDNESLNCLNEFKRNKCGILDIPAMADKCREWEVCMKKDSLNYENISLISASVIASSIKHFISQLDLKSLLFLLFIFLLILYRNRPQRHDYSGGAYNTDARNRYSERLNRYFVPNYMNKQLYPYVNNR